MTWADRLKNTPEGRVRAQLFLGPFMLGVMVFFDLIDRRAPPSPVFAWLLAIGVAGYVASWLRFVGRRHLFLAYYRTALSVTVMLTYGIALGLYGVLNRGNSALVLPARLTGIGMLFLSSLIYSFAWSQRRYWKYAIPLQVSKGNIDPVRGVDLLAPIGYDSPFQTRLQRALDRGWQGAIIAFVAGLSVFAGGHSPRLSEQLTFIAFIGSGVLCAFALSRLFWSTYYIGQYERHHRLHLVIRGLARE